MRTTEVKSAGRILDVLELLAGMPQGIRLNQLARTLAIPKSSASGLLGTLAMRGYVEATGQGYRLANGYRGGGWVGGITGTLVRAGHPVMEKLVAETGESAFLGIATPSFDIRYVAEDAKLSFVFTRRGIIPEANSTWLVPRLVGLSRGLDVLLSGRTFTGREAAEWGLCSRALPAGEVLPAALELAHDIADNTAPLSVALTKQLVYESMDAAARPQAITREGRRSST